MRYPYQTPSHTDEVPTDFFAAVCECGNDMTEDEEQVGACAYCQAEDHAEMRADEMRAEGRRYR